MIGVLAAPVAVLAIPQLDFIRRWLVPIAFGALTCAISGLLLQNLKALEQALPQPLETC